MEKLRVDFVSLVLPEVLKDPGAYYITHKNAKRVSTTLTKLLHATVLPPKLPVIRKRRKILRNLPGKNNKKTRANMFNIK